MIDKLLDQTGRKLVMLLQENGRFSFSELGRRIGLSTPAVAERVRRLEESGVISGYHAVVNPHKLGLALTAFIRLHTTSDRYKRLLTLAEQNPAIVECHHVTGEEALLLKALVPSMAELDTLLAELGKYGRTTTSIVISSPVQKRVLVTAVDDHTTP
ncbi:MAG: Lrp/AsnC family transcriptional regulator [Chloroflexota bacterium]